jgi:hypothetical protein
MGEERLTSGRAGSVSSGWVRLESKLSCSGLCRITSGLLGTWAAARVLEKLPKASKQMRMIIKRGTNFVRI